MLSYKIYFYLALKKEKRRCNNQQRVSYDYAFFVFSTTIKLLKPRLLFWLFFCCFFLPFCFRVNIPFWRYFHTASYFKLLSILTGKLTLVFVLNLLFNFLCPVIYKIWYRFNTSSVYRPYQNNIL